MATRKSKSPRVELDLTIDEVNHLVEALDSHAYWQLADQQYRNNGVVIGRGADEPTPRRELLRTNALYVKLNAALRAGPECHLLSDDVQEAIAAAGNKNFTDRKDFRFADEE